MLNCPTCEKFDGEKCERFGRQAGMAVCPYAVERKPITNYGRIINKSPEELAEWLVLVEQRILGMHPTLERPAIYADWLDWLKQEVNNGET